MPGKRMLRLLRRLSRIPALLPGLSLLLALSLASAAGAQVSVYHSPGDTGLDPGEPLALPVGPYESIFLYIDAGTAATQNGTPCFDGDGRELCGFEVTLDAFGGASFANFIPTQGSDIVANVTPNQIRLNGLFSLNPALGPERIAEIQVTSQEGGEVMVEGGTIIGAALQSEDIPQLIVATTQVPEPASWAMFAAGSLLLGRLAARRAARQRLAG